MSSDDKFNFVISLSVLNALGRKLYRSFATVLGEAISNSWDADARNVWIYVDRTDNSFVIKDDGDGMTPDDFQNKFLKIGYSKRRDGKTHSPSGRPYIGRKGIGKLALLSCAETVSVISKPAGGTYVDGLIDNGELDKAITEDMNPQEYPLSHVNPNDFKRFIPGHNRGTIIYFSNLKTGIWNTIDYLRKMLALYFRFSLVDKEFTIWVDDKPITLDDLSDLADKTEFLWVINALKDSFVSEKLRYERRNLTRDVNLLEPGKKVVSQGQFKGFIASVRKPTDLKVVSTDERIGVDLFVNGRLRERDILRHIPTAKLPENYLYGQIHFDILDDEKDRFSTAREDIVADDELFAGLLNYLRRVLAEVIADWDIWRRKHHKEGDPENTSIPKKERKAEELYNVVSEEFAIPEDPFRPGNKEKIDKWIDGLTADASYNFASYADAFVSENLIRKHIEEKNLTSKEAKEEIGRMKQREKDSKNKGNVSIDIRVKPTDVSYLGMDGLANLVDKAQNPTKEAALSRDAAEYKPIRDALMHTALLTPEAKKKLSSVFENIRARVKRLLSGG